MSASTPHGGQTRGRALAVDCMAPLRKLSDEEDWPWPVHIGVMQDMLALVLDALFEEKRVKGEVNDLRETIRILKGERDPGHVVTSVSPAADAAEERAQDHPPHLEPVDPSIPPHLEQAYRPMAAQEPLDPHEIVVRQSLSTGLAEIGIDHKLTPTDVTALARKVAYPSV